MSVARWRVRFCSLDTTVLVHLFTYQLQIMHVSKDKTFSAYYLYSFFYYPPENNHSIEYEINKYECGEDSQPNIGGERAGQASPAREVARSGSHETRHLQKERGMENPWPYSVIRVCL